MSPELMRVEIKKVYPYQKWHDRVDKMTDYQVRNVYTRMLNKKQLVK